MELSVFSWGGIFPTKAYAFDQARKTIPAGLELGNWKASKDSVATAGISLGSQEARRTARLPPHGFAHTRHELVTRSEALASLLSEGVQELPDLDACNEIA